MTEISKYTTSTSAAASDVSVTTVSLKAFYTQVLDSPAGTTATVSTLAQQISDAASRAAARDAKLGWNELASAAQTIVDRIVGSTYQSNQARNDAEVPGTDDPAARARAKQATDFLHSKAANPFAGMPREQLVLIAYDEGGSFTLNERAAAWSEASQQESAWRKQIDSKSMESFHRTGNSNAQGVGRELLDHYKSLSPIERAQYPRSYEVQLQVMAESSSRYSKSPQLDALNFLAQLSKWAKAKEADGFSSEGLTDVGVLPKPDLAKFEADALLPLKELWAKYEKAAASFLFNSQAEADAAYAEMPDSDDPDRLAQAVKARAYSVGKGPSPFSSLTRNELVAIYYEDSGIYTTSERLAAVGQLNEIDTRIWNPVTSRLSMTGDARELLEMGLKAYDEALPIEKMQWGGPAYKILAQQQLAEANAEAGGPIGKKRRETLLEMLEALNPRQTEPDAETNGKDDIARPWSKSWSAKLSELLRNMDEKKGGDSSRSAVNNGNAASAAAALPQQGAVSSDRDI